MSQDQIPEQEQYQDIYEFIQHLPDMNCEDNLSPLWNRYRVDGETVLSLTDHLAQEYLERLTIFTAVKQGVVDNDSLPEDKKIPEKVLERNPDAVRYMRTCLMAIALQMFAFGSEFQQRWVLPDMVQEIRAAEIEIDHLIEASHE